MSLTRELWDQIKDDWTSNEPPRIAKKALVALFAAQAFLLAGAMVITACEGGRAAYHLLNHQTQTLRSPLNNG